MSTKMMIPKLSDERAVRYELTTELILAEEPFLRRVANGLARQSADADDLVQETMLRAYKARSHFEAGTSIRAWLTTILRRLFLTAVRTERRRATHVNTDSEDVLARVCDTSEGTASAERTETPALHLELVDDDVKRAFDRLPGEYRELFTLVVLDGLSYREIATKLHIPVGTVMSRMYRARLRILSTVGNRKIA